MDLLSQSNPSNIDANNPIHSQNTKNTEKNSKKNKESSNFVLGNVKNSTPSKKLKKLQIKQ